MSTESHGSHDEPQEPIAVLTLTVAGGARNVLSCEYLGMKMKMHALGS